MRNKTDCFGGAFGKGCRSLLVGLSFPFVASAQASGPVSIAGVAFDSLRNTSLARASINLSGAGSSQSTSSDSRGRFHFDSVTPGSYSIVMYHAALDSVGLAGISKRLVVVAGTDSLRIATPSFATLWRAACGTNTPPADSGFVFGAIRDVEHEAPIPNATISLSWLQIAVDSSRLPSKGKKVKGLPKITQQRWGGDVHSDARGNYAVCGVPTDLALQVAATSGTEVSGILDLPPLDEHSRIRRRDLLLGAPGDSAKPRPTGVVAGRVRRASGEGVADARVAVDGAAEVRSGTDGRFVVPNVPLGTREVEVLSVGAAPFVEGIDVTARDTTTLEVTLQKVTALGPVKVTARTAHELRFEQIQERVAQGLGHYADSTKIEGQNAIVNAIAMIDTPKNICELVLDGVKYFRSDMFQELKFRSPKDIALIEVYREENVPGEYRDRRCGDKVVLVWTKLNIR